MPWRFGAFPEYVPVAERRAKALAQARKLAKRGRKLQPIALDGRKIASSFWGKAWCDNLESYSDFANRLPRGRTYVRNGSVIDLRIAPGRIDALVAGSSLYEVQIRIGKLSKSREKKLTGQCRGQIDSAVSLLRGQVPQSLLDAFADRGSGLFPAPAEIDLFCSCPDAAVMCKHVAAVLYGVGARFDKAPETFFTLRSLSLDDLVAKSVPQRLGKQEIADSALESIFGIELDRRR
ncbi:MAG: SWIM zinc finger family protein [Myxococcales bacterium]|nr:SWIM zinc finger family protein [Myxococcales bacterium]